MYKIISSQLLNPAICKMIIEEPNIANKARPGQFVVIRVDNTGERIPLTVVDTDKSKGSFAIIFQLVGTTTFKLARQKPGSLLVDVVGPLGLPTHIENFGKALFIGGGVGVAEIYPGVKALKEAGNEVSVIIGARTKELLILEDELKAVSDKLYITTDDGSCAKKGFVTDVLKELLQGQDKKPAVIFVVGPAPMMKAVCDMTKPHGIKTVVSLNANMVDATGMCGTCRVTVAGKIKFSCVDGPEFDGHEVDFKELMLRNNRFLKQEKESLELFKHKCKLESYA